MKLRFDKKILIIGYGAVSRCLLPILVSHLEAPFENVTIIDFEDKAEAVKEWTAIGMSFVQIRITPENLAEVLSGYLEEKGMLIDLGWNIGCNDILDWCHKNNVLYVNASVEQWDPYKDQEKKSAYEKSLYWRHMQLREMMKSWKEKGPTAVLDHGANPGLISHFVKQGLIDIASRLIKEKKVSEKEASDLKDLLRKRDFPRLY